ncbi:MAG: hypothetical protein SNG59_08290, partial [Rikenellaceae bacterium]
FFDLVIPASPPRHSRLSSSSFPPLLLVIPVKTGILKTEHLSLKDPRIREDDVIYGTMDKCFLKFHFPIENNT